MPGSFSLPRGPGQTRAEPVSMNVPATRFGAPWFPPRAAAAVLRARSLRYSIANLTEVSDENAAASVIGADMWMLATRANTLDNPMRYGTPAVLALTASLARSAGWPRQAPASMLSTAWPTDEMLIAAESYEQWLIELDLPVGLVFSLAIEDLEHGSSDTRLAQAIQAFRPFSM